MPHPTFAKARGIWVNRLLSLGFVAAFASQGYVQIVRSSLILDRVSGSESKSVDFAERGLVLAADGSPLAQQQDVFSMTVSFKNVPHSMGFFSDLSKASGIPASEFSQLLSLGVKGQTWQEPISAKQKEEIENVRKNWGAGGITLTPVGTRVYPLGESTAGFLGMVKGQAPVCGLELGWNKILAGKNGMTVGLKDRDGRFLPMRANERASQSRMDGETITLTIDTDLQMAATLAVKSAVEKNHAENGAAVVYDPKTGDILAMANWPSFDPNDVTGTGSRSKVRSDFNLNYMEPLEPGSTFKILTLAKALDKGVLGPDEHVSCNLTMTISGKTFGCDKKHGAHGSVGPQDAIARSCNIAAANWALRIGREDFLQYIKDMGLLEKPGLGLPQEARGLFDDTETAQKLQLALLGFGQPINCTPIALASAFSTLANNGLRMKPRLVKQIGTKEIKSQVAGQIIKSETAQELLTCMEAVVESDRGTGKTLRIPGYRIGGKTGTAQKRNAATGSMKGGGYVSNFVGFVPADKPRAVILVMINNPDKRIAYYGAAVAGPAFQDIAKAVIHKLQIPKSQ